MLNFYHFDNFVITYFSDNLKSEFFRFFLFFFFFFDNLNRLRESLLEMKNVMRMLVRGSRCNFYCAFRRPSHDWFFYIVYLFKRENDHRRQMWATISWIFPVWCKLENFRVADVLFVVHSLQTTITPLAFEWKFKIYYVYCELKLG